jgi:hypothetical protein
VGIRVTISKEASSHQNTSTCISRIGSSGIKYLISTISVKLISLVNLNVNLSADYRIVVFQP